MKKLSILQAGLIAVATLIIGLFIGMAVKNVSTSTDELTGAIGKLDRYRNVKMSDDDILLRNELVDDSTKRLQYEKYFMYYYYQALQTSSDLKKVLNKTAMVVDFDEVNRPYADALTSFSQYLEAARVDILDALDMIKSMNEDQDIPIISYLTKAQNAIARISSHDDILLNYMNDIAYFLEAHPDANYPELVDAHDILALNILQAAVVTQNKPILSYFDKKSLKNNKERAKSLIDETSLKMSMQDQFLLDVDKLNVSRSHASTLQGDPMMGMEKLEGIKWTDMEQYIGLMPLGTIYLLDQSMIGNQELLQSIMLASTSGLQTGFSSMEIMQLCILDSERLKLER